MDTLIVVYQVSDGLRTKKVYTPQELQSFLDGQALAMEDVVIVAGGLARVAKEYGQVAVPARVAFVDTRCPCCDSIGAKIDGLLDVFVCNKCKAHYNWLGIATSVVKCTCGKHQPDQPAWIKEE